MGASLACTSASDAHPVEITSIDLAVLKIKKSIQRLEGSIDLLERDIHADGVEALRKRAQKVLAMNILRRRRARCALRERLSAHVLRLHEALVRFDSARADAETLEAMRLGNDAVERIVRETTDVESVMRDVERLRHWFEAANEGAILSDADVEEDFAELVRSEARARVAAGEVRDGKAMDTAESVLASMPSAPSEIHPTSGASVPNGEPRRRVAVAEDAG